MWTTAEEVIISASVKIMQFCITHEIIFLFAFSLILLFFFIFVIFIQKVFWEYFNAKGISFGRKVHCMYKKCFHTKMIAEKD